MLTQNCIDQIISTCKKEAPFGELHAPSLKGKEKEYLQDCIDNNSISSIGNFVDQFSGAIKSYTKAAHAVPLINGTMALQMALQLVGVRAGDIVVTQPLSFVATTNAIHNIGAEPAFLDVSLDTLSISPANLRYFFETKCAINRNGKLVFKDSGWNIGAVVPVHVLGIPGRIDEIVHLCNHYGVPVVEDAAEALGSWYMGKHCGTWGQAGILSFNGNKTITTGGGGMLLTDDPDIAEKARHISTQAKVADPYEYLHDEIGTNYRMSNLAAAVGCAQMERLGDILRAKNEHYKAYKAMAAELGLGFMDCLPWGEWNKWLIPIITGGYADRNAIIDAGKDAGIQFRPMWYPLNKLPMNIHCYSMDTPVTEEVHSQFLCLPSGVDV